MGQKLPLAIVILLSVSFASAMADSGQLSVVSGLTYQVNYKTTDAAIQSIQANKDSLSLELSVHATSPVASVELTMPRDLIDAKNTDGTDEVFIVLVDGTFATYTETNTSSQMRTILIPLSPDNKDIEIIGTNLGTAKLISQNNTQPTLPAPKPIEQKPTPNKTSVQPPTPSQNNVQNKTQNIESTPNIIQQLSSILHLDLSKLSLNFDTKQLVEYSVIGAIAIVVVIVIASSTKKNQKKISR